MLGAADTLVKVTHRKDKAIGGVLQCFECTVRLECLAERL